MRPKESESGGLKVFIVASFYSPPRSPKKSKLLDHILTTVHMLLSKYPKAGIVIGGDKNNLNKLGLSWAKLSCQMGFGCTVNNICCLILINMK